MKDMGNNVVKNQETSIYEDNEPLAKQSSQQTSVPCDQQVHVAVRPGAQYLSTSSSALFV